MTGRRGQDLPDFPPSVIWICPGVHVGVAESKIRHRPKPKPKPCIGLHTMRLIKPNITVTIVSIYACLWCYYKWMLKSCLEIFALLPLLSFVSRSGPLYRTYRAYSFYYFKRQYTPPGDSNFGSNLKHSFSGRRANRFVTDHCVRKQ